jgi:hypothetical protein
MKLTIFGVCLFKDLKGGVMKMQTNQSLISKRIFKNAFCRKDFTMHSNYLHKPGLDVHLLYGFRLASGSGNAWILSKASSFANLLCCLD